MAMTLSQYRSPTVFPNQTEYNNAMEQAYQSGLAAKSSYQHGMESGDENARLQTLYAKQKELEQRKSEIDSRIKEIQVHLEQTKDYMNDPLYRTARSKYIWEGDDTNLVNYRKMQNELAKTKATEELNKQMRERSEEASKITLRNRANAAQEILDTTEKKPENTSIIAKAKQELKESIEQLANMGEIYKPKQTTVTTVTTDNELPRKIASMKADISALVNGKFTEEQRSKLLADLDKYEQVSPDNNEIIQLRDELMKKKSKENISDTKATNDSTYNELATAWNNALASGNRDAMENAWDALDKFVDKHKDYKMPNSITTKAKTIGGK